MKRCLVRQVLIVSFFLSAVSFLIYSVSRADQEKTNSPDVLIIYSSGIPFKTISDMKSKEVDAVTTPTPLRENSRTIAEKLASILREKKLLVRVAATNEIKHRNEILDVHLVVLGTPVRFWNVSWEMKKLLDEQFGQIYVLGKGGLAKRRVGAFAMAEIDSSAQDGLTAIEKVIKDCKGRFGPTMTFLTKHPKKLISRRINQFANKVAMAVKENQSLISEPSVLTVP